MLQYKTYIFSFLLLFNTVSFASLVRPVDGEELNYIHVFFEWEQQPDAMGYNLQASTHQSFNNIILDMDESTTVYIDKDTFSWDDNYYSDLSIMMEAVGRGLNHHSFQSERLCY